MELITDNVHIHPAMVRFTFNTFGADHVCLIADSMMACGLPDGQYSLGGQGCHGQGPAGHPDRAARYHCRQQYLPVRLHEACRAGDERAAGERRARRQREPARSIGVDNDYGSLAAGRYGNVILADKELNIKAVIQKGTRIV